MQQSEKTTKDQTIMSERAVGINSSDDDDSIKEVDPKALLRKMDLRFIPWLSFLYFLSFLDRTSIGNAKLYGLEADIHITDRQYLTALTIFFISYWAFEVPSNIFLKKLRPSIWIPICMTCWGICMTLQGVVQNYGGLLAIRFLLGVFEASLFPGVIYFFSCWYKRSELGLRTSIFASMVTVSGAFGGLLAAAISNMQGVGGKPAWSWIFILEGLITIVAGILSFWIVADFPDTATFITEAERRYIVERLQDDGQFSAEGEKFQLKHIMTAFRDYKTWLCTLVAIGYEGPGYAFALFTPSIINELGFRATPANLLSVPVYVFAGVLTCLVGYYADRLGNRGYFNFGCFSVGIVGYTILITSHNATLSYIAIYLAAAGIYPIVANSATWFANNTEGSYKRGVTVATAIGFGNLQGIVSSNVYRAQDAPRYILGHAVQLGYISLGFVASLMLTLVFHRENRKRERGERDEIILSKDQILDPETETRNKRNGVFETVEDARREKGDKWSGFRYYL